MLDKPYIYNSNADFDNVNIFLTEKEKTVAKWVYVNNKMLRVQLLVHCRKQMHYIYPFAEIIKYMVLSELIWLVIQHLVNMRKI